MQSHLTTECLRQRKQRARRASMNVAVVLAVLAAAPFGAATLDPIRETGHVRFGFLKDAPPFSFRNGDSAPQGYAVDLCETVAKSLPMDARIVRLGDYREALQQLIAGDVDVVFGDRVVMLGALQGLKPKARENVAILDRMFTHEPAALAMRRSDEDFRASVDRALSRLYASSEFAALYSKWCGEFDQDVRTFFSWNTVPE